MEEEEYLAALNLEEKNLILVRRLLYSLRRRKIRGSYEVAKQTAKLLKEILDTEEWNTAQQAINFLHKLGFLLSKIQPVELSSGNIIRRVLYFIRDWYLKYKSGNFKQLVNRDDRKTGLASGPTLRRLLTFDDDDFSTPFEDLKAQVIDDIVELLDELDGLYHSVSEEANHHIHSKEIIMTYGRSNTVVEFLKEAAKERDFSVVVAECAPSNSGHLTASNLSQHEIDTTLIPDSAIFAMMARVNKVIVGTHAVLADGGLIGSSGLRMLAQAAKYYSVPFVVCAGMYKICPLYLSTHLDNFLDLNSPSQILNFEEVDRITKSNQNGVTVQNPGLDFVPPELVSLFLTNAGTFSPSYISRVLSEFYFQEDHSFRTITHSHAQHTSGVDSIAIDSSDDESSP